MLSLPQTMGQSTDDLSFPGDDFNCPFIGARNLPCRESKEILDPVLDVPCWSKHTPWGAEHRQALPGVPRGVWRCGAGGSTQWLLAGRPGRTATLAELGVIASVHAHLCTVETV